MTCSALRALFALVFLFLWYHNAFLVHHLLLKLPVVRYLRIITSLHFLLVTSTVSVLSLSINFYFHDEVTWSCFIVERKFLSLKSLWTLFCFLEPAKPKRKKEWRVWIMKTNIYITSVSSRSIMWEEESNGIWVLPRERSEAKISFSSCLYVRTLCGSTGACESGNLSICGL